jgi:hypothetical protein
MAMEIGERFSAAVGAVLVMLSIFCELKAVPDGDTF